MKQFINDMIHMTEGERLINYWWLWTGMVIAFALVLLFSIRKGRKK